MTRPRSQAGYDTKCYELAEYFLGEPVAMTSEAKKAELAQVIQDAIEDWLAGEGL